MLIDEMHFWGKAKDFSYKFTATALLLLKIVADLSGRIYMLEMSMFSP